MGRLKNIILDILKDKKYLKETLLVLLGGIIINALCFLLPLIVHAEGTYYPVESGVNAPLGAFTVEQILDYCNNYSSLLAVMIIIILLKLMMLVIIIIRQQLRLMFVFLVNLFFK